MTEFGPVHRLRRDGLHAYLDDDGAFVGAGIPLLKRDGYGRWQTRPQVELETLLVIGLGFSINLGWRMVKLAAVARALNAGDRSLAAITLVQTELPPLPDRAAAQRMAKADGIEKAYDPNEPRDEYGAWTTGNSSPTSFSAASKPAPERTAQADIGTMTDAASTTAQREITSTNLRGLGPTNLDAEFADRIAALDRYAQQAE